MINTEQLNFENLLVQLEADDYPIGQYGAMMHIYETQCAYTTIYQNLMSEALINQSDQGKSDTMTLIGFLTKLIDGLIHLIVTGIKKLVMIFKRFSARAKDVYMNNTEFLKKYGARLNKIKDVMVNVEGYSMSNSNIIAKATMVGSESEYIFDAAKMIILEGKPYFSSHNDIDRKINKTRLKILESSNSSLVDSNNSFREAVKRKYYGDFKTRTYAVYEALDHMARYESSLSSVKSANELAVKQGNHDIEELNRLKRLMKGNSMYRNTRELVEQFNMLSKYRTQTMQDCIYVFETVMRYIDDTNLQAKAICILALQQN